VNEGKSLEMGVGRRGYARWGCVERVATFAGPVLAARISMRDQNNVVPDERAGGRFSRLLKSVWLQSPWILPPLLILNYIVQLIFDLRKTGPVTRGSIFVIAFDTAGVVWGAVLLIVLIWKEQTLLLDIIKDLLGTQRDIISGLKDLSSHRRKSTGTSSKL
jgi:hypothetical protein